MLDEDEAVDSCRGGEEAGEAVDAGDIEDEDALQRTEDDDDGVVSSSSSRSEKLTVSIFGPDSGSAVMDEVSFSTQQSLPD